MLSIYCLLGMLWTGFQAALWSSRNLPNIIIKSLFTACCIWYLCQLIQERADPDINDPIFATITSERAQFIVITGLSLFYSGFSMLWTEQNRYDQISKWAFIGLAMLGPIYLLTRQIL